MQARAREDIIIRIKEVWNLEATLHELIEKTERHIGLTAGNRDSETRGLRALLQGKLARLRRLQAEWEKRFGHWRSAAPNVAEAVRAIEGDDDEEQREEQGANDDE